VNIIHPPPEQAEAIVQAMYAVASAEGTIELLAIERESVAAIQRHLLHSKVDPYPGIEAFPEHLAEVVSDPDMRLQVLRILLMLPFLDQRVLPEKARVVHRAARLLEVRDSGLDILDQAVKRQYRRITFGIMRRAIKQFRSQNDKARWRHYVDVVMMMFPMLTRNKCSLRSKYQSLASKSPGSLGKTLYEFYRGNGFAMPGEPRSFPEKFVLHELYHIFSGYPVTRQGEMLVAAFEGGNVEQLCMDMILMSLLQDQVGTTVAGVDRGIPGQLKPDEFFHAIARGAAMSVDLMEGWDFWCVADRKLQDLQDEYGLPPLSGS